jgi:hypothetical protein
VASLREDYQRTTGNITETDIAVVIGCILSAVGAVMEEENPQSEVTRLRKTQFLARQQEIYGGFSPAERTEYDNRAKRIEELDAQLQAIAFTDKAAAEQRREWNKSSETDTPKSEARQPYYSREKDSTTTLTESSKTDPASRTRNPNNRR